MFFMLFRDQLIPLSLEEIQNPKDVIKGVFGEVKLEELRDMISKVIEVCLTTNNQQFCTADDRYELLSTFNKIEYIVAAATLL
jgi:hypothetical protein